MMVQNEHWYGQPRPASNEVTVPLVRLTRSRPSIGAGAPALRKIDDADGRIAVGGDEHETAHRLRALRHVGRQQLRVLVGAAEMDEDRGAFGDRAAVLEHERWHLPERIHREQVGVRVVPIPRRRLDDAKRCACDDERRLDRGGSRT